MDKIRNDIFKENLKISSRETAKESQENKLRWDGHASRQAGETEDV